MTDHQPTCRAERIHPVTLEIVESAHDGRPTFRARARYNGMVTAVLGPARDTELEAFDDIARSLAVASR